MKQGGVRLQRLSAPGVAERKGNACLAALRRHGHNPAGQLQQRFGRDIIRTDAGREQRNQRCKQRKQIFIFHISVKNQKRHIQRDGSDSDFGRSAYRSSSGDISAR